MLASYGNQFSYAKIVIFVISCFVFYNNMIIIVYKILGNIIYSKKLFKIFPANNFAEFRGNSEQI